jgi:hypothetical protein
MNAPSDSVYPTVFPASLRLLRQLDFVHHKSSGLTELARLALNAEISDKDTKTGT